MDGREFGELVCHNKHHCGVYDCDCHNEDCYVSDDE